MCDSEREMHWHVTWLDRDNASDLQVVLHVLKTHGNRWCIPGWCSVHREHWYRTECIKSRPQHCESKWCQWRMYLFTSFHSTVLLLFKLVRFKLSWWLRRPSNSLDMRTMMMPVGNQSVTDSDAGYNIFKGLNTVLPFPSLSVHLSIVVSYFQCLIYISVYAESYCT